MPSVFPPSLADKIPVLRNRGCSREAKVVAQATQAFKTSLRKLGLCPIEWIDNNFIEGRHKYLGGCIHFNTLEELHQALMVLSQTHSFSLNEEFVQQQIEHERQHLKMSEQLPGASSSKRVCSLRFGYDPSQNPMGVLWQFDVPELGVSTLTPLEEALVTAAPALMSEGDYQVLLRLGFSSPTEVRRAIDKYNEDNPSAKLPSLPQYSLETILYHWKVNGFSLDNPPPSEYLPVGFSLGDKKRQKSPSAAMQTGQPCIPAKVPSRPGIVDRALASVC